MCVCVCGGGGGGGLRRKGGWLVGLGRLFILGRHTHNSNTNSVHTAEILTSVSRHKKDP